jgi:hypothetical protein
MSAAIPRFEAVLTDEHGISSNFRINVRLKPYDSRRSWLYEVPMMEHRGFTNELWHSITSIYNEILVHSFLRDLTDGTLTEERFRFYVLQDAIYLREYARALSLARVRSPDESALVMFNQEHRRGRRTTRL